MVFLLLLLTSIQMTRVRSQSTSVISGVVLDQDNQPLVDAFVGVLGPRSFKNTILTDSSGRFDLTVNQEGWYTVFVMCDRPETPGMDYVPAEWSTYLQQDSTSSFRFLLSQGASIYLEGDVRFVESSEPADYHRFTVEGHEIPLAKGPSIVTYGTDVDLVRRFGFDDRLVIVPADTEVEIEVYAKISRQNIGHNFWVKGKPGYFKLAQGESLRLDIREHNMLFNFENVKTVWDSSLPLLEDAEDAGFLVNLERQDLLDAYKMMKESMFTLKAGSYDESLAKLRNAYILTAGSADKIRGLIAISSQSALLLVFLFVFVASASAYLITERKSRMIIRARTREFSVSINLLIAVAFYALLVGSFYVSYPGCHLVSQHIFAATSVFSLIIGQAFVFFSPRAISERRSEQRSIQFRSAMIAAFSMGCRNLRRRKMRTTLSLTNIAVLVFGFIAFTSLSPGYGLVSRPLRPSLPIDCLLVRDEPLEADVSRAAFTALPESFLQWLESQPNVTVIAPKAENRPISAVGDPLGYLYSRSGDSMMVFGILGIVPSLEANLTLLNNTIIEGEYLKDDDIQGVLISSSLKQDLNVDVGDKLYGFKQEFTIRGFFDDGALRALLDIDGVEMIPYWIVPLSGPEPCIGNRVIVLLYEKALTLPGVSLSRVNIQLENYDDYSFLAGIIALTREYKVYISHSGSLYHQSVSSYIEEKGAGLTPFLMLIVMLNIAVSMLGSVRERREEISSLSSVGLNPSHIAALFIAESVVIGFVGGGFGYLSGIFGYRIASHTLFGALQVREKVSAEWGLVALLLSGCTAALASLVPALQASTVITPSLLRKWRLRETEEPIEKDQPWVVDLPIKLMPKEVEPFTGFILKRMRESAGEVTGIRLQEEIVDTHPLKKIIFNFSLASSRGSQWSKNELVIEQAGNLHSNVRLFCVPAKQLRDTVHRTASLIRKLIFEWNAITFEVATPFDASLSQLYTLVNAYSPSTLYIITTEHDLDDRLDMFRKELAVRGLRPPRIVISGVKPLDVEEIMKAAEELVSRADVVCISGKPTELSTALAMHAAKQRKMTCCVVDPRPEKERRKNPFEILKIVNVN